MDPQPIRGTLGARWEYPLQGRVTHTVTPRGQFKVNTWHVLWRGGRKPENPGNMKAGIWGPWSCKLGFFLIRWWFHYILQTVLLKHLLYGSTPWSDPELGLYALCGGFTFFLYASMWISFRFSDFIPPPKNIPVGPLARVSYSYMWTGNPYSVYSHHTPSGPGIKLRIPDQDKVLTDE